MREIMPAGLLLLLIIANDFGQSQTSNYDDFKILYDASQCDNKPDDDNRPRISQKKSFCNPLVPGFRDNETRYIFFKELVTQNISVYFQDMKSGDCLAVQMEPFEDYVSVRGSKSFSINETCHVPDSQTMDTKLIRKRDRMYLNVTRYEDFHGHKFAVASENPSISFNESVNFDRVCISRIEPIISNDECYPVLGLGYEDCVSFAAERDQQIFPDVRFWMFGNSFAPINISLALDVESVLSLTTQDNLTIEFYINPSKNIIRAREKDLKGFSGEYMELRNVSINTQKVVILMEFSFVDELLNITVDGKRMERSISFPFSQFRSQGFFDFKVNVTHGFMNFNSICYGRDSESGDMMECDGCVCT